MKKYLLLTVLALMTVATLPACSNTLHGAGEDIENSGEAVQKAVPPKS